MPYAARQAGECEGRGENDRGPLRAQPLRQSSNANGLGSSDGHSVLCLRAPLWAYWVFQRASIAVRSAPDRESEDPRESTAYLVHEIGGALRIGNKRTVRCGVFPAGTIGQWTLARDFP